MNPSNKILLQSSANEPMPVNTTITITASEPGEDEFAFKLVGNQGFIQYRTATTCNVTSATAGAVVVEAADAKKNTATITVEFFDVPS